MAGAQKGTEFALCLNSFNRDVQAYPDTNDFRLELLDRYKDQITGGKEQTYARKDKMVHTDTKCQVCVREGEAPRMNLPTQAFMCSLL